MIEERNLFIKKMDNKLEMLKEKKYVKKILAIKNIYIKKIIKKMLIMIIIFSYKYRSFKCQANITKEGNNIFCEIPIEKINARSISKIKKCINKVAEENKVKKIILSKELTKVKELRNDFLNENIQEGKYLMKLMIDDVISYIGNIRNEPIENQTIYILVCEYSKINLQIIELLSSKVKSVNIVTNKLNRFLKFEKNLYEKQGIMIPISNNKKKALSRANLIINMDFSNDYIKQYKVNRNAVIINLVEEKIELPKGFLGVFVNGLEIENVFNKKIQCPCLYRSFNNTILYESTISRNKKLLDIKKKIKDDNIKIKSLIGISRKDKF